MEEFSYKKLMITTLIISGCSIVYELLISAISSYLLGDSVTQFSITIGIYLFAMGFGSYLSKFIRKNLFDHFIFIEISIGLIGGATPLILFFSHIYTKFYSLIMFLAILIIGLLVGLEIPVLTRIIEENCKNLRVTLSNIFSFDYMGGLLGSLLFPLVLLPKLGYIQTALVTGILNLYVAFFLLKNYSKYIKKNILFKVIVISSCILMAICAIFSKKLSFAIESKLYRDPIIMTKHTKYQNVVLTKFSDDLRLYINGNIQFSSSDEYRYHEALVHVPMSLIDKKENILILGGGDGLAAREILKYSDVKKITLVDLDSEITKLSQTNSLITKLNNNSLNNEKVNVINCDAFKYLTDVKEKFDCIIIDLPDPNVEALNKLYTNIFYRLVSRALNDKGIISVQSTSPYFAREAFWCINKTLKSENLKVIPYQLYVPSFGSWGFNLASKENIDLGKFKLDVNTSFLNYDTFKRMFSLSKDEILDSNKVEINTILNPKLIYYYLKAEEKIH